MTATINVNGRPRSTQATDDTPLLYALRNDIELNSVKYGCGVGICGACTVLLDGQPVRSCITPVSAAAKGKVTTLESLGSLDRMGALQRAFVEEQAAQCGFCTNGMIMTAQAFLATNPSPTEEQIRTAMAGNLCRCGTHTRIIKAVKRAASTMKEL